MISLLSKILDRRSISYTSKGVGDVYTFRTKEIYKDVPASTNRFGMFKVLGKGDGTTAIIVYDVVTIGRAPRIIELRSAEPLVQERFYYSNRREPCVMHVHTETLQNELVELKFLANAKPQQSELDALAKYEGYSGANFINHAVEGEWRWKNDRLKLQQEQFDNETREAKRRQDEEIRLKTRLKGLTWEKLESETQFADWSLPPAEFTLASRNVVKSAIAQFKAVAAKPTKREARRILISSVLTLNELDVSFGNPIETVEREDIMVVLEEIAHVAKHPDLIQLIDEKREW